MPAAVATPATEDAAIAAAAAAAALEEFRGPLGEAFGWEGGPPLSLNYAFNTDELGKGRRVEGVHNV